MLGNRLKTFGINKKELFARIVFGILSVALAVFVVSESFISGWHGGFISNFGTVILVCSSIYGVWMFASAIETMWKMPHLDIHEHGVNLVIRGKENEWLWDDIQYIKGNVTYYRSYLLLMPSSGSYRFSNDYRELFRLDNRIASVSDAYNLIASQVNALLLSAYRERLQMREIIPFGEIKLSSQTVIKGKKEIPLSEVANASVVNGHLVIQAGNKGGKITLMMESAVNPFLLIQLVKELSKARIPTS